MVVCNLSNKRLFIRNKSSSPSTCQVFHVSCKLTLLLFFSFQEKKEKAKTESQTQQENMTERSRHAYNEEEHPLQSEAWACAAVAASTAHLLGSSVFLFYPSCQCMAWTQDLSRKKSKGEVQKGRRLFLCWGQRDLSDSTGAQQAQRPAGSSHK